MPKMKNGEQKSSCYIIVDCLIILLLIALAVSAISLIMGYPFMIFNWGKDQWITFGVFAPFGIIGGIFGQPANDHD